MFVKYAATHLTDTHINTIALGVNVAEHPQLENANNLVLNEVHLELGSAGALDTRKQLVDAIEEAVYRSFWNDAPDSVGYTDLAKQYPNKSEAERYRLGLSELDQTKAYVAFELIKDSLEFYSRPLTTSESGLRMMSVLREDEENEIESCDPIVCKLIESFTDSKIPFKISEFYNMTRIACAGSVVDDDLVHYNQPYYIALGMADAIAKHYIAQGEKDQTVIGKHISDILWSKLTADEGSALLHSAFIHCGYSDAYVDYNVVDFEEPVQIMCTDDFEPEREYLLDPDQPWTLGGSVDGQQAIRCSFLQTDGIFKAIDAVHVFWLAPCTSLFKAMEHVKIKAPIVLPQNSEVPVFDGAHIPDQNMYSANEGISWNTPLAEDEDDCDIEEVLVNYNACVSAHQSQCNMVQWAYENYAAEALDAIADKLSEEVQTYYQSDLQLNTVWKDPKARKEMAVLKFLGRATDLYIEEVQDSEEMRMAYFILDILYYDLRKIEECRAFYGRVVEKRLKAILENN